MRGLFEFREEFFNGAGRFLIILALDEDMAKFKDESEEWDPCESFFSDNFNGVRDGMDEDRDIEEARMIGDEDIILV